MNTTLASLILKKMGVSSNPLALAVGPSIPIPVKMLEL
jgi:hypothetical protein